MNQPADSDPAEQPAGAEQPATDERKMQGALLGSLVVVVAIACVVGAVVWWTGRETEPLEVEEVPLVQPEVQRKESDPPRVAFRDIAQESGLIWSHTNGARGDKLLPETMGPGCAFFDYDGDGDQDILLVNGTYWPDDPAREAEGYRAPTLALFRNDAGGKRFDDVTREVGLDLSLYGQGVAVGDIDGDGDSDLFVTAVGRNRLLRNDKGQFKDVTDAAGVGGDAADWSTSAAFFDADNDGDLDLFVCNYVRWSAEIDSAVGHQLVGLGRAYAPPTLFEGAQPDLWRNRGDGTFERATEEAGITQKNSATGLPEAKALGVIPVDADDDGWIDLFVANDTVGNFFYQNLGDGKFEEIGAISGLAYDPNGKATGAMGVDAAWFRNDRTLGIAVGNFANEMSSLYVAEDGEILFTDDAITDGLGPVSRQMLSFGLFFFDYDLDGWLDLFQANGHLEEEINKVQSSQRYRQPAQLFWNCGPECTATFTPVDSKTTGDLSQPVVGRAAAYADIDQDGDLDILLAQTGDRVVLLRNDQALGHHWIRIRLYGAHANTDAIGARVEVTAEGVTRRQQVMPSRSYLSQVEPTLTFGLGKADSVESVRVYWPGETQAVDLGTLPVDQLHKISQSAD